MAETCTTIDCCEPDVFANPVEPDTDNFNVAVTITPEDSGTVTGDGQHERLSTVTLTAVPEGGFAFVAWKDANGFILSEDEEWTFVVTQNMSVIAEFI